MNGFALMHNLGILSLRLVDVGRTSDQIVVVFLVRSVLTPLQVQQSSSRQVCMRYSKGYHECLSRSDVQLH